MQVLRIPKGNGKYRTVYAPEKEEKEHLQSLIPALVKIAKVRCHPQVVHGFMPGRSPLTNALPHVGFTYTLNMDLKDFFDTVLISHVMDLIPPELLADVMRYGAARQGLPTSPVVANIAAAAMDWEFLVELPDGVVYTRYADDLSFSFDDQRHIGTIKSLATVLINKHKFAVNPKKTHVQWAGAGRRIITGVAVDEHRAYPTRAVRRRLRAARHQKNPGSRAGLTEWCKMKLPALYLEEARKQRLALDNQHAALPYIAEESEHYGKEHRSLHLE
jgi:hypothetical protein